MHYAPHYQHDSQNRFFLPPHWVCWLWAMFCSPCTMMPWYWYPPQNQQKNCTKIQQGHMKYCRISSLRRDLRVHENRDFLYQGDWVCRVSDLLEMKGWSLTPFVWAKKCQKTSHKKSSLQNECLVPTCFWRSSLIRSPSVLWDVFLAKICPKRKPSQTFKTEKLFNVIKLSQCRQPSARFSFCWAQKRPGSHPKRTVLAWGDEKTDLMSPEIKYIDLKTPPCNAWIRFFLTTQSRKSVFDPCHYAYHHHGKNNKKHVTKPARTP